MGRMVKISSASILVIIFVILYWYGANQQLTLNPRHDSDQGATMGIAIKMVEQNYSYDGDRNRMPLYPFLQSLFYHTSMTEETFMEQGIWTNMVLSLVILAGLFLIFIRNFPLLHSINLILITAFFVFVFKAPFFQPELLFYFLFFCAFVLMSTMLIRPTWKLGIITGVIIGLSHLTKASVLPALGLFLMCFALKETYGLWIGWKTKVLANHQERKVIVSRLASGALVPLCFIVVVFPYISKSKSVYGSYFYNVNSTFYLWYDSWNQAKQGTAQYGDRYGWPNMPPEDIPSPAKYLREHTPEQMWSRVTSGAQETIHRAVTAYGYFNYVIIYSLFGLVAIAFAFRQSLVEARRHIFLVLFVLSLFASYFVLYAWFVPIGSGPRFFLALFLPFLFSVSVVLVRFTPNIPVRWLKRQINLLDVLNGLVLLILVANIHFVLTYSILQVFGGK
jgi:hypothetical protein